MKYLKLYNTTSAMNADLANLETPYVVLSKDNISGVVYGRYVEESGGDTPGGDTPGLEAFGFDLLTKNGDSIYNYSLNENDYDIINNQIVIELTLVNPNNLEINGVVLEAGSVEGYINISFNQNTNKYTIALPLASYNQETIVQFEKYDNPDPDNTLNLMITCEPFDENTHFNGLKIYHEEDDDNPYEYCYIGGYLWRTNHFGAGGGSMSGPTYFCMTIKSENNLLFEIEINNNTTISIYKNDISNQYITDITNNWYTIDIMKIFEDWYNGYVTPEEGHTYTVDYFWIDNVEYNVDLNKWQFIEVE